MIEGGEQVIDIIACHSSVLFYFLSLPSDAFSWHTFNKPIDL